MQHFDRHREGAKLAARSRKLIATLSQLIDDAESYQENWGTEILPPHELAELRTRRLALTEALPYYDCGAAVPNWIVQLM